MYPMLTKLDVFVDEGRTTICTAVLAAITVAVEILLVALSIELLLTIEFHFVLSSLLIVCLAGPSRKTKAIRLV